jgi:uncharacterized protein (UPF0276 family)
MSEFSRLLARSPRLGVGISGEYGSSLKGFNPLHVRERHPNLIHFFEYGGDVERGLDDCVTRWAAAGLPVTYHFLDVNLEERDDLDAAWLSRTQALAAAVNAAWLCGDAGRWHFGRRERGHQLLLPPILCRESAAECAENVRRVQEIADTLCLPENPPAVVFLGDLHILDYFALVADAADCGLLLDCAHLAIFQRSRNLPPLAGIDGFPLERIVELHIAGGAVTDANGFEYLDDTHGPEPVAEAWEIFEYVVARAVNLRAVVYECEWNQPEECIPNFIRLNELFPATLP